MQGISSHASDAQNSVKRIRILCVDLASHDQQRSESAARTGGPPGGVPDQAHSSITASPFQQLFMFGPFPTCALSLHRRLSLSPLLVASILPTSVFALPAHTRQPAA